MSKQITHYEVDISDSTGISGPRNIFSINKYSVLAENDRYIVINDSRFTSLRKTESDWEECLGHAQIILNADDRTWGNRISYSLYTDREVKAEKIRKTIEKAVTKKYGFFIGTLNLDVIKD